MLQNKQIFSFLSKSVTIAQAPKIRLTRKVRRVEDVIVEVLLHQNARHPLALNTLIISQRTHHLREDETFASKMHERNADAYKCS